LSQIFGELPRDDTEQPHLEDCNGPLAVESASTDHPKQRQQHIRFSKHALIDSGPSSRPFRFPLNSRSVEANKMPPQFPGSSPDALGRKTSTRRQPTHPSHTSQLESARLGLGQLRRAGSTGSTGTDESPRGVGHPSIVENKPTRSSSLRITNGQTRLKDRSRRRTVHNPDTDAIQAHSRRSTELFTPTHSQRRSVTLWARRRITKDDSTQKGGSTGREGDSSAQPLTEAQRIQSIRRGRKLAQVFGTEPPISLYKVTSPFEDEPAASPSPITGESIEYLALPSSDLPSLCPDDRSSMNLSHAAISPISTSFVSSSGSTTDPFQECESEQRPATPIVHSQISDDDPDSIQTQDPPERSDGNDTRFRRRRLQAAKLSRFFGIAYNDLAKPVAASRNQPEIPSADIKIQERGWFWGRTDGAYSRARAPDDMNDVIALLRQMPRA